MNARSTQAATRAELAALLTAARDYWEFALPSPATMPVSWHCATCGRDTHAQSPTDSRYCLRCAPKSDWHAAPFGRVRKVAPAIAARWDADDDT